MTFVSKRGTGARYALSLSPISDGEGGQHINNASQGFWTKKRTEQNHAMEPMQFSNVRRKELLARHIPRLRSFNPRNIERGLDEDREA